MIKQYIALMFLLAILKSYSNDFTHEELYIIKERVEVYPILTNLIAYQEKEIDELYFAFDTMNIKHKKKTRKVIFVSVCVSASAFFVGFFIGVKK